MRVKEKSLDFRLLSYEILLFISVYLIRFLIHYVRIHKVKSNISSISSIKIKPANEITMATCLMVLMSRKFSFKAKSIFPLEDMESKYKARREIGNETTGDTNIINPKKK